jgi:DNA-binding response OmpR family regulator
MKRLLLVDSDMTVQQWAEASFQNEGFEVTSYGDGLSALDMLSKIEPDVVLVQYHLAGMSIFRFCDKLRQKEGAKKSALFILCDNEDSVDRVRLDAAGISGIIQKPMKLADVLGKIGGTGAESLAAAPKAPEAPVAPSVPEEEGLKMEELLGWSKSEEKTGSGSSTARSAEPQPVAGGLAFEEDDRTVVAGSDLEQSVVKSWEGTGVLPGEESTVVTSGVPKASPAEAVAPSNEATVAESPDSRLISGSMAELSQASVRPEGFPETRPMPGSIPQGDIEAAVSKAAREIIEKVAWEVVPTIAEAMIKEELEKLKSEKAD